MMKPQNFRFQTNTPVILWHCHTQEPDSKEKFGPTACGEYSLYMLLDDAEARKLMDKIDEVITKTIPHLQKHISEFHYPGRLDEKTGLYKFRCKQNPKFGKPEIIHKESGLAMRSEISNGSTGEVYGVVHPYENYGGGIKLIFKRIIVHRLAGSKQQWESAFAAKPTVAPPWEDNEPAKPVISVKTVQPAKRYTFAPPVPPPSPTPIRREPTIDTFVGSLQRTTIAEPIRPPSTPAPTNDNDAGVLAARFVSMRMRSIGR